MTGWQLYDHSKKAYTYGSEYGYANTGKWYDQLTTYNYNSVNYTGTGHISSYRSVFSGTKRFYWNDEGKLSSARADGTASFEYDANGMRTLKEGTFDHEYYYEGTRLVMETVDGVKLIYLYDESGNVEAIRYNNASYYLIRNILGDVVQLRNAQNELIANYSYNAYGLPLSITNASGTEITNEAHIALINPIRYRGYYYDNETGLYYLESRYYDPELCRFISADALLIASPIGMNLYAYCNNDPVNFADPHGYECNGTYGNCQFGGCCEEGIDSGCRCIKPGCPFYQMIEEEEKELISIQNSSLGVSFTGFFPKSTIKIFRAVVNFFNNVPGWKLESKTEDSVCFVAGTMISHEDGNVPIEEIKTGDYVWAWNEQTGEVELKRVVETYINETKELVHVFVNGEEIIVTPSHPFYSPVKGWTSAVNLRAGDVLVLINGEYVVIDKIQHEILECPISVYNFAVEDFHTYYAGHSAVLVHNTCPSLRGVGGQGWVGDKSWRENVTTVGKGGTITSLKGGTPTAFQAIKLIEQSGGTYLRIEDPHEYPNPHTYAHINYQTSTGEKGTIKILDWREN